MLVCCLTLPDPPFVGGCARRTSSYVPVIMQARTEFSPDQVLTHAARAAAKQLNKL